MALRYLRRVSKETPTKFWINNPTDLDVELAIAAGTVGCTINPAYCSKLIDREGRYIHGLIDQVTKDIEDDDLAAETVNEKAALRIMRHFMPLYRHSGGAWGYVTVQGDPRVDDDSEAIIRAAQRGAALSENFMAKIPVTVAGIKAIEHLITEDIPLCATEVFSIDQAIYICELYKRVAEQCGKHPPFYVTHMTGIFEKYLAGFVKDNNIDIDADVLAQAGCAIARKQYHLLKDRNYECTMLGGARANQHFTEMVGADMHIAINWSTAESLIAIDPPVESRIDAKVSQAVIDELSEKLPDFRKAFYENEHAPEEFENFGPLVLLRNMFLDGYNALVGEIRARRQRASRQVSATRGNKFCDLSGQIALVTGGATGIGAEIVEYLASLGARVACCYFKSRDRAEYLAETLNQNGEVVFPVQMDVTDSSGVESAVTTVAEHFGDSITILVNNAGDMSEPSLIECMSEDMWNAELRLNLTSFFLCSKYCIPSMKAKQYGRIINNSSVAARLGGGPGYAHYTACKGGVEAFTRGLAKELAPFNVTVNTVAPGVINTPIHQRSYTAGNLENIKKRVPLGRLGAPEDVAAAVAFLASAQASYITGQTISVNGGLRMD